MVNLKMSLGRGMNRIKNVLMRAQIPRGARLLCAYKSVRLWLVISIGLMALPALGDDSQPKDFSKPYVERQTFKGQAYYKDSNDWVYTPAFAKTFGMPPENIYPELKGIEAAAFRVEEESNQQCGLGGKAENCTDEFRCVTDVYIDESKYPLPWATSEQSDWLSSYNSLQWLQAPNNDIGYYPKLPEGVKSNYPWPFRASLRPFADPESHLEVTLQENSNTPYLEDVHSNGVAIYGYKRKAIAGLTMLSLNYNCLRRNSEKHTVTFRLDSWSWSMVAVRSSNGSTSSSCRMCSIARSISALKREARFASRI